MQKKYTRRGHGCLRQASLSHNQSSFLIVSQVWRPSESGSKKIKGEIESLVVHQTWGI